MIGCSPFCHEAEGPKNRPGQFLAEHIRSKGPPARPLLTGRLTSPFLLLTMERDGYSPKQCLLGILRSGGAGVVRRYFEPCG